MSKIPEVFAIFEQKLAHVLSFTVVPLKSKDLKNALEEILTYFSSIVERASKAESRIAELEYQLEDWTNNGWAEDYKARIVELEAERRWIPVSERLPKEKQSVLALDRTGTAYHWEYSKRLSNIFVGYYTHWMPLPEPPEVENV